MAKYAKQTTISRSKSRDQIEAMLRRYGAEIIITNDTNLEHVLLVGWMLQGIQYKFVLPLPDPKDERFTLTETGKERDIDVSMKYYDQAMLQYWRIAYQYLYMMHELQVATGMEFKEIFAPLAVFKDGTTVWQRAAEVIETISKGNGMEALMPPDKGKRGA